MKPRCALRVGVIGNRRFAGETDQETTPEAQAAIKNASAALGEVWKAIFDGIVQALKQPLPQASGGKMRFVQDLFDTADPPRVAVLTSLAAGADQIGAQQAIARGKTHESGLLVEVEAVLPFGETDYPGLPDARRPEFRKDEADTLRELAAGACQVVRLDGLYSDPDLQVQAYRQASAFVRQNADLLIAVYDPAATPKAGGTIESVGLALESGTPVIGVLVDQNNAGVSIRTHSSARRLTPADEWGESHLLGKDEKPSWPSELAAAIATQLSLPQADRWQGHNRSEPHASRDDSKEFKHAFLRLGLISGDETLPGITCGALRARIFQAAWKSVLAMTGIVAGSERRHGFPSSVATGAPTTFPVTLDPYDTYYARASDLTGAYMRTYRGGFVLSYFLAWLAVVTAVTGVTWWVVSEPPLWIIAVLGALKLTLIVVLYLLESSGHRERFQEAGADFRYLAELLRPMQWLAPLGVTPPSVEVPIHATWHDPARSWMVWMVRAISRSVPAVARRGQDGRWQRPRVVTIDAAAAAEALRQARSEWLKEQGEYFTVNARKMRGLDEGLERIAKWSIAGVFIAACLALVLEVLAKIEYEPFAHVAHWAHDRHPTAMVLSALAVVLPAFVAVIAGLSFQSEAKRIAMRYEAMYLAVRGYQRELEESERTLSSSLQHPGEAMRAAQMLRKVSAVTIGEAADWKLLYEVHGIPSL